MYRYLCAGIMSLAIHFLIFTPLLDQPVMALPMTQQTQSVSISFATIAKPEPVPEKVAVPEPVKTLPTPPPVTAPKKEPAPTTQKKRIVKEDAVKKVQKKETPKPIKKVEKKQPTVKKTVTEPVRPNNITPAPSKPVTPTAPATPISKLKTAEDKKQVAKQSNGLQDKPQLIEKSRFLSKPTPPKYPRMAKRKGLEGTVTYEVWLDEKGKQIKFLLKNSSGAKVLDVAALKAIKSWEFSPHSINGKQIAHRIYIPISFQLD
jgi:protein TonB